MIIALAVLVTLLAAYYGRNDARLTKDGATAPAISLELDRQRPGISKDLSATPYRYQAAYTFADEGGTVHAGRQTIDRSRYDALQGRAPDTVTIYYSRTDPSVSSLDRGSTRLTAVALFLLALFGWGLVIVRVFRG
jgi:uncharacterized protein DUF3592